MQRWLTMIILKDLKLGISEKKILRNLHPDAEEYYNVTMDLRKVMYLITLVTAIYCIIILNIISNVN